MSDIEYKDNLLYVLSFTSIFFGIYTIISKNPIVSVLFLIGLFTTVSLYLIVIGLYFIGLSYLLIYIGAISILFVFILMLINIRVSELITDSNNSTVLAALTVVLFNISLYDIIPNNINITDVFNANSINIRSTNWIYSIFASDYKSDHNDYLYKNIISMESVCWDSALMFVSHITSIGNLLYTIYFIPFIVLSLILLLAMGGAIIITVGRPEDKNK